MGALSKNGLGFRVAFEFGREMGPWVSRAVAVFFEGLGLRV